MEKQAIREAVWDELENSGVARFPFPPHGRIPNFAGADEAADRLRETPTWGDVTSIKANPDAPQRPVRYRALDDGKTVYMAVPRLQDELPFIELDPDRIEDIDEASTIGGATDHGRQVGIEEMAHIDFVVAGSVAVDEHGTRIGKGEGYSDLEFAILSEAERVDEMTAVATTVHERQVRAEPIEAGSHDVPMDLVVTPGRVLETGSSKRRPAGIDWSLLDDETVSAIPVLDQFRPV